MDIAQRPFLNSSTLEVKIPLGAKVSFWSLKNVTQYAGFYDGHLEGSLELVR